MRSGTWCGLVGRVRRESIAAKKEAYYFSHNYWFLGICYRRVVVTLQMHRKKSAEAWNYSFFILNVFCHCRGLRLQNNAMNKIIYSILSGADTEDMKVHHSLCPTRNIDRDSILHFLLLNLVGWNWIQLIERYRREFIKK